MAATAGLRRCAFILGMVFFAGVASPDEIPLVLGFQCRGGSGGQAVLDTSAQLQTGVSSEIVGALPAGSGCEAFDLGQTSYGPTSSTDFSGAFILGAEGSAGVEDDFDFVFSAGHTDFPELAVRFSRVPDLTTAAPLVEMSTDPWTGQRRLRLAPRKIRYRGATEDVLPVPEPDSMGLCCLGVLIMAWWIRRRGLERQSMPGRLWAKCRSKSPITCR